MYKPDLRNTCCRLYPVCFAILECFIDGRFERRRRSLSRGGSIGRMLIGLIGISKEKTGRPKSLGLHQRDQKIKSYSIDNHD